MEKCKKCKYYYEQFDWFAMQAPYYKGCREMCARTGKPILGILKCNGFEEGGKE